MPSLSVRAALPLLLGPFLAAGPAPSGAAPASRPSELIAGTIVAERDGVAVHFPSLRTDYQAEIRGDLASVTVTQRFVNPGSALMNATYLFPLPDEAAVPTRCAWRSARRRSRR